MRLTVQLLGLELDVTIGPVVEAEPETTHGDALSTPVGFTRAEVPWEDVGSLHQFEPEDRRR